MEMAALYNPIRKTGSMNILSRRTISFETLEDRCLLSLSVDGNSAFVNVGSIGEQRLSGEADAIAMLEDGSSIVSFSGRGVPDHDGVYFRRIDAEGLATNPVQLANQTVAGRQHNATVTVLHDGGFVVAWDGRGLGDRQGVFARWYDKFASPLSGEIRINQTTGGRQSNPEIAVAADGTVAFVWQGVGVGDFDGVFFRRFGPAGAPLGGEVLVNTTTAREQAFADIAVGGDDAFLVTWSSRHQDGSDWGVYGRKLGSSGAKLGVEFRVNTATTGSQIASDVTTVDGGFAVAWQSRDQDGDGWGVYAQKLTDVGEFVGDEFRLNEHTLGNQQQVALAGADEGAIIVTWTEGKKDGAGWNVQAREVELSSVAPVLRNVFSVHPETATTEFGHQAAPSISIRGNHAAIAWSGDGALDHSGVYLQRYSVSVNLAPNLAPIPDQVAQLGVELVVILTATDVNVNDTLTFLLDSDNSPAGATIEKTSNRQAIIRWKPQAIDLPGPILIRALVADNGVPSLVDAEEFFVTLTG